MFNFESEKESTADCGRIQAFLLTATVSAATAASTKRSAKVINKALRKADELSDAQVGSTTDADLGASSDCELEDIHVGKWEHLGGRLASLLALEDDELPQEILLPPGMGPFPGQVKAWKDNAEELSDAETASVADADSDLDLGALSDSEAEDVHVGKWEGIGGRLASLLALDDEESPQDILLLGGMGPLPGCRTIRQNGNASTPAENGNASPESELEDVHVDKWESIGARLASLLDLDDEESPQDILLPAGMGPFPGQVPAWKKKADEISDTETASAADADFSDFGMCSDNEAASSDEASEDNHVEKWEGLGGRLALLLTLDDDEPLYEADEWSEVDLDNTDSEDETRTDSTAEPAASDWMALSDGDAEDIDCGEKCSCLQKWPLGNSLEDTLL